jgi:2-amino-4-hydroxy-6-hydroxymethyldihydropteridine diphosphokinase
MDAAVVAFVGLGANLGEAAQTLREALRELDALPATRLLRASRLYRTPAWGVQAQPDFVNAVAMLETALPPRDLLDALLALERAHGRDRTHETRWGPRTLDLDLLVHGDAHIDEPGLRVPHPHLHERAFVLLPLAEIAPDAIVPGAGRVRELAAAMAGEGIQAIG